MDPKQVIRKQYLAKRKLLSPEEVDELSSEISKRTVSLISGKEQINYIHIFLPIKSLNEVNTWKVIEDLTQNQPQIKICVPKVGPDGKSMIHYILDRDDLVTSKWNIPEPAGNTKLVNESSIDLVILPMLAYDLHGNRIGYGKAFYDRFLKNCRPDVVTVGLSFFEAIPFIQSSRWDVPMQYCITPEKVYDFSKVV